LSFAPKVELEPKTTALVIIDMQYASASPTKGLASILRDKDLAHLGEYRFNRLEKTVIPSIRKLLGYFRANELPVIYVTLGSEKGDFSDIAPPLRLVEAELDNRVGSETHEILAELRPLDYEIVVNKTTISAFTSSPIDAMLRRLGIKNLIFTGVSTSQCVETTARDAADRGYGCVLVEDGCAEDEEDQHNATLKQFARIFGRVSTTAAIIEELQRKNS